MQVPDTQSSRLSYPREGVRHFLQSVSVQQRLQPLLKAPGFRYLLALFFILSVGERPAPAYLHT